MNNDDYKVVTFKNISDFEFTPVLGAMFNSRPIFGNIEKDKIMPGEELQLPGHIGKRVAINLAKQMLVRGIPREEYGKGDPTASQAAFGDEKINELVSKILVNQYQEEKPILETETDRLFKKYEELNKVVAELKAQGIKQEGYKDKQEVINELEKREIAHDKRKSKAELEALLA
jgi:hypothetical protein